MTRWDCLMEALGVTASTFKMEHASKFDLSPAAWLKSRLEDLGPEDEVAPEFEFKCDKPCCEEAK